MLLAIILWLLAPAFGTDKVVLHTFHITGFAQGTTYSIIYYAADSAVTKDHVETLLQKVDSSMSVYKPYSLISRFNASRTGLQIDSIFSNVVQKSIEVYHQTNGAFDITVSPLVHAWGFGPKKTSSLPDSAAILSLLKCVGTPQLELNKNFLHKKNACITIDVNGIAQGYTVDLLADLLERKGIVNYLVELGGEIRVNGRKPSGELLTIGIESPSQNQFEQTPLQKRIAVEGGAITTSGNYRKFYEGRSGRITHLIDPKTGFPIQNELISVTVFAKKAITADGFDNALMVMGLQKSLAFLSERNDLEAYFIYHKADGGVSDTATKGFYKLMAD
jgi:thiamine biosynthesis lipoprotein